MKEKDIISLKKSIIAFLLLVAGTTASICLYSAEINHKKEMQKEQKTEINFKISKNGKLN